MRGDSPKNVTLVTSSFKISAVGLHEKASKNHKGTQIAKGSQAPDEALYQALISLQVALERACHEFLLLTSLLWDVSS